MHRKFSRLPQFEEGDFLMEPSLDEYLRKIQKHQETFLLPCQVTLQPDESTDKREATLLRPIVLDSFQLKSPALRNLKENTLYMKQPEWLAHIFGRQNEKKKAPRSCRPVTELHSRKEEGEKQSHPEGGVGLRATAHRQNMAAGTREDRGECFFFLFFF